MRSLRANLRALAAPLSAPELTGQIQKRLRQEAAARPRGRAARVPGGGISWGDVRRFWFNTFANWLDGRRTKIFSQGVGAIVSFPLFLVVVTGVFTQARLTLSPPTTGPSAIIEIANEEALRNQAQIKAALFSSPPPPTLNPTYEFVGVAASLSEEDVIMTAEGIRKDGGAAKVTFPLPPNDPSIQAKLSTAMSQRGIFYKPNQNIGTVAVVYLSSTTTIGRL